MSTKASRSRQARNNSKYGKAFERDLEKLHRDCGIPCKRTFSAQSAMRSQLTPDKAYDMNIAVCGKSLRGEAKASRTHNGYSSIVQWMQNTDLLFVKVQYGDPIVCMPFSIYEKLVKGNM
jgi:hypothetical protein